MRKSSSKLIASGFLVLVAVTLMVTVSYAWFTMAGSPALTGVQINIGGSNTIKIAADRMKVVNGQAVHYPGPFRESMNISEESTYDYLDNLAGLTPVSTSDGLHWYMPAADANMEIQSDQNLKDYLMDNTLMYANILAEDAPDEEIGSYAYLDFWVVSPMDDCTLRVSIGSADEGSYLVALPKIVEDTSKPTGYTLEVDDEVAACARVGFLVNSVDVTSDEPMELYSDSSYYLSEHKKLKGIYAEPGTQVVDTYNYNFSIYEPNGTKHNNEGISYVQTVSGLEYISCEDGDYAITFPIGRDGENVRLKNVASKLAVQGTNEWKLAENGEMLLEQIFQSAMLKKDLSGLTEEQIAQLFYRSVLQDNYAEYVSRAAFFEDTSDLYTSGNGKVIKETEMLHIEYANATTDAAIVKLERDVPQRIRMFVWLEGQDVDCVRQASSEYFAIGIELAGSTQD